MLSVMKFFPDNKAITTALRYMRVPPDKHNYELILTVKNAFTKLQEFITPHFLWGRFHILHVDNGIQLEYTFIHSKDILRLTSRSDECILIAATLGHETDRQISIAQKKNMLEGLALDSCASVMIDSCIDEYIQSEIVPSLRENERLTHRFSPGYGDLSMNVTEDIIAILDAAKRIGLSVTRSLMMSPIKSVTAVIGLYNKVFTENKTK